jgi:hypothetical protein
MFNNPSPDASSKDAHENVCTFEAPLVNDYS